MSEDTIAYHLQIYGKDELLHDIRGWAKECEIERKVNSKGPVIQVTLQEADRYEQTRQPKDDSHGALAGDA